MLNAPHNFRSIKAGTFDDTVPRSGRVGMIAAGNPDVLREAMGLESYAGKRKRGGRVKLGAIGGAHARRRLDRRSRRPKKFETGGESADARASVSGTVAVYALAWSEDRARMAAAAGAAGSRDPSRLIFAEQLLLLSGGRVRLQFARAADAGLADAQVALGELY